MKILMFGAQGEAALERSYKRSFEALGHACVLLSPKDLVNQYLPFGPIGRKLYTHVGSPVADRKMNRLLMEKAVEFQPDLVLVFTNAPVLPGTLGFLKSRFPAMKLGFIWPDALGNVTNYVVNNAPFFDFSAVYADSCNDFFRTLGIKRQISLPFAGDTDLHKREPLDNGFKRDIAFIGGWRPEREAVISAIAKALGPQSVTVVGRDWLPNIKDKSLKKSIHTQPLFGKAYSDFINSTRINLNIIDFQNLPGANMRFFEVPVAGGLQLCSRAAEWEAEFVQRQDICYFSDQAEMLEELRFLMENPEAANHIRRSGYNKILQKHTYINRAETLLSEIRN